MPEITVAALNKRYGHNVVLNDVTFTVQDHEFLTLLGPSGCGKTTTLMSVAGFLRPDSGTITCAGRTFSDSAAKMFLAAEDRNIGIVFQSYAIWPHMTVFGNVAFPLKVRRTKRPEVRRRVMETLDLVEMADFAGRYPHELSGGQQQRVALARALVYSPSVLLLDEPFSNLDAKLRERARNWLMNLQRDLGLTTLFVTHDQDEALSLSDRIIVMNNGEIQQVGRPEQIYRQPDNRFVAEFLGHCNILAATVTGTDGSVTTVQLNDAGQTITVASDTVSVGERIDIVIRPESIELTEPRRDERSTDANVYRVKVTATAFLGDHYVYELDLDGLPLTASDSRALTAKELDAFIPPPACRAMAA